MKYPVGYKELKYNLEKSFDDAGIAEKSDIDWIIVEVTGKKRSMLPFIETFSNDELEKIMIVVSKRLKHIPLAYIFGKTNFYGYDFIVDQNVLIPRIDTEVLVEKVISEIKSRNNQVQVLDIGTGSGAIAITLNKETGCKMLAVDISENALEIAKKNAILNNADVDFVKSNLFDEIKNFKADIIVSNPPYIESLTINALDEEVRNNEPILALDGGKDGLDFYKKIIAEAKQHLTQNGKIFFEIGYNQAKSVCDLLKKDFKNVIVIKDYEGNDRVVVGELL